MHSKRKQGNEIESAVAQALARRGFRIVGQNLYTRYGEVDILAEHNGVLHAIEVKYRSTNAFGHGAEAVDMRKLQHMNRAVGDLRKQGRIPTKQLVYSVAAVYGPVEKLYIQFFQNIGWEDVQKYQ